MIYEHEESGEQIRIGSRERELERFLARMRRRFNAWAAALSELDMKRVKIYRIGLTYRPGIEWEKGHITEFRMALQKELGDNLLAYAWWAEMQKRGAVHYHMHIVVRRRLMAYVPYPDQSGMWKHGSSSLKVLKDLAIGYALSSYATKKHQKEGPFPRGMHKFEVWIRDDVISGTARWFFRVSVFPEWVGRRAIRMMAAGKGDMSIVPSIGDDGFWRFGKHRFRSPWRWVSGLDHLYPDAKVL